MRDRYRQRIAKHTPCACQTALVAKNLGCSGNLILQNSLPQLENETYKLLHPERNQRRSSVFLQDFRIKNFSKIVCACPEHENFLIISLLGEFFVFIFLVFLLAPPAQRMGKSHLRASAVQVMDGIMSILSFQGITRASWLFGSLLSTSKSID